jgi:hypothetical protein
MKRVILNRALFDYFVNLEAKVSIGDMTLDHMTKDLFKVVDVVVVDVVVVVVVVVDVVVVVVVDVVVVVVVAVDVVVVVVVVVDVVIVVVESYTTILATSKKMLSVADIHKNQIRNE